MRSWHLGTALLGIFILMMSSATVRTTSSKGWSAANLPPELADDDFIGVSNTESYAAMHLRESESAQEFFFDDLMGLEAQRTDSGYQFRNTVLDIKDTVVDQQLIDWANRVGAKSYLVDDGDNGLLVFRNAFQSSRPGDPVIGASAFYTSDDTNLCGYIAVSYLYNGLTGNVTLSPMEVILAQTTLPAGRGLTTFFPALPPLSLHLGGITPRDLSTVANLVLAGTGYTSRRVVGQLSDAQITTAVQETLTAGLPLIAFVSIIYEGRSDGYRSDANGTLTPSSSYGHFVVVTGYAENSGSVTYRIRNPYDNRVEYYAESDFLASVIRSADTEYGGSLILVERVEA